MNVLRPTRSGFMRVLGAFIAAGLGLALAGGAVPGWAEPVEASPCDTVRVAVFDVGSGTTRARVAELSLCEPRRWDILFAAETAVGYAADLADSGRRCFSDDIRQQGTSAMVELVEAARAHGAERLVGVATQAFRVADNAPELLADWRSKLGLDIQIISQREEGRLAYRMIEADRADRSAPLVVWDIGAASQQLVWRDPGDLQLRHFHSTLASVSFRNLAIEYLERAPGTRSPNPISAAEAASLRDLVVEQVADAVPDALLAVIAQGAEVVGVGGVHGASLVNQAGLSRGDTLSRQRLLEALDSRLGLDDAQIGGAYADTDVTNLILVLALMDVYGIETYRATRSDLTAGVLLSRDFTAPDVPGQSLPASEPGEEAAERLWPSESRVPGAP